MFKRALIGLLFCSIFAFRAAADSRRAAVLDGDGRALVVIDLEAGTIAGKVALPLAGTSMLVTPDGSRAIVLSRGAGSETFFSGRFRPSTKASAAVVDLAAMKVIANPDLGFALGDWLFGANGTLYILSPGFQSPKDDHRGTTLTALDPKTGQVKRLEFARGADGFGMVGDLGAVFFKAWPKQKLAAELRLVDLAKLEEKNVVTLEGEPEPPVVLPRAAYLYAIDGRKTGKVQVISVADGSIAATLDLGEEPKLGAVDSETQRVYVMSKKGENGFVHVLRGKDEEVSIPIAFEPEKLEISGHWLFVVGQTFKRRFGGFREAFVARVDLKDNTVGPTVETGRGTPAAFITTDDAQKVVVFHGDQQSCCAVTVDDVVNGKKIGAVETGSRGERIASAILAGVATAASYSSSRSAAKASGQSTFYYTIYEPRRRGPSRGPMVLRADGKVAYALDPPTDDLTICDVETATKIANFDVGSGVKDVVTLGDGSVVAAVSDASVVLVDTAKNEKGEEIKLNGEVNDFAVSPGRKHALVVGKQKVILLDGQTGKARQTFSELTRPVQVVFLE